MPRGRERILTYVRERDSAGRLVVRAVEGPGLGGIPASGGPLPASGFRAPAGSADGKDSL